MEQLENTSENMIEPDMDADVDMNMVTEDGPDAAIADILEESGVNEENQKKIMSIIMESHMIHSGPLPPPQMLKQYNELPGVLDIITNMAMSEMNHRHSMEERLVISEVRLNESQITYVESNIKMKLRIQIFSFIITILLIILGFICIIFDKNIAGASLFVGGIGGLCGTLFYGKKELKKDDNSNDHENKSGEEMQED